MRGLKFEVQLETPVSLAVAQTFISNQWNVFKRTSEKLKCGLISLETFNGNSVITELTIKSPGFIELFVADILVDLSSFLISNHIKFNKTAVTVYSKPCDGLSLSWSLLRSW